MDEVSKFYNLLYCFMEDLQAVFPEEHYTIAKYRLSTEALYKLNSKMVPELFVKYVSPYEEQIESCDEDFFLKNDVEDIIQKSDPAGKKEDQQESIVEGLKLKELWVNPNTTDHTKACVWSYMQLLLRQALKAIL